MFHLIASAIFFYVALRLVVPLPLGRKAKLAAVLALLLVAEQHFFMRYFLGGMAAPGLPFGALLIQGWLYGAFILLALFLLAMDTVALFFALARRIGLPLRLPFSQAKRASLLLVLALCLAAYGEWQAIREPETRSVEVVLDRLPPALDGLSLVQITDPHASALLRGPRLRAIVDRTLAMQPDLVLLTGDLVDGKPSDRAGDVAPLKDLRARFGVFACPGNHEYYSDYDAWMRAFADMGIVELTNSHRVLSVRGQPLVIAGLTDPAASRFGLPEPDIRAALAGIPPDVPIILMAHQPRAAPENALAGVDLQLSGHTHGGQIVWLRPLIGRFNAGFISGWYSLDKGNGRGEMKMYVSNGAGLWAGFPIRLGVPAEITRIVLRSPEKQ